MCTCTCVYVIFTLSSEILCPRILVTWGLRADKYFVHVSSLILKATFLLSSVCCRLQFLMNMRPGRRKGLSGLWVRSLSDLKWQSQLEIEGLISSVNISVWSKKANYFFNYRKGKKKSQVSCRIHCLWDFKVDLSQLDFFSPLLWSSKLHSK